MNKPNVREVVDVFDVTCERGHDIDASSFAAWGGTPWTEWPIPCSVEMLRSGPIHLGCGAGLLFGLAAQEPNVLTFSRRLNARDKERPF